MFADDIDDLAGTDIELTNLIKDIYHISRSYVMEIKSMKTQIIINSEGESTSEIKVNNEPP